MEKPVTSPVSRSAYTPGETYDPSEVFKIVMHIDGRILDIELPEGAERTDCKGEVDRVFAALSYATTRCNPPCVAPKVCRCVSSGGVNMCFCR
jgi:hypothetical protein